MSGKQSPGCCTVSFWMCMRIMGVFLIIVWLASVVMQIVFVLKIHRSSAEDDTLRLEALEALDEEDGGLFGSRRHQEDAAGGLSSYFNLEDLRVVVSNWYRHQTTGDPLVESVMLNLSKNLLEDQNLSHNNNNNNNNNNNQEMIFAGNNDTAASDTFLFDILATQDNEINDPDVGPPTEAVKNVTTSKGTTFGADIGEANQEPNTVSDLTSGALENLTTKGFDSEPLVLTLGELRDQRMLTTMQPPRSSNLINNALTEPRSLTGENISQEIPHFHGGKTYESLLQERFNDSSAWRERLRKIARPKTWKMVHPGTLANRTTTLVFTALFRQYGYEVTEASRKIVPADVDFAWSHELPYHWFPFASLNSSISNQFRINHFPSGLSSLTNRLKMAQNFDASFVSKAFSVPRDLEALRERVRQYPERIYMVKRWGDRRAWFDSGANISLVIDQSINTEENTPNFRLLAHELISEPLLLAGSRFYLSFYVAVTSVDPLRVYVFDGVISAWLCEESPTNDQTVDGKGVYMCPMATQMDLTNSSINGTYSRLYNDLKSTSTDVLFRQLEGAGVDAKGISQRIDNMLKTSTLFAAKIEQEFASRRHIESSYDGFVQLLKFDTVVDQAGDVHLVQVSMPDFGGHTESLGNNVLGSELSRVCHNFLTLAGVTPLFTSDGATLEPEFRESNLGNLVPEKELYVYSDACTSGLCGNCPTLILECSLCSTCMAASTRALLRRSYWEHEKRGSWRRLTPPTFASRDQAALGRPQTSPKVISVSEADWTADQTLAMWYRGKCLQDKTWCA